MADKLPDDSPYTRATWDSQLLELGADAEDRAWLAKQFEYINSRQGDKLSGVIDIINADHARMLRRSALLLLIYLNVLSDARDALAEGKDDKTLAGQMLSLGILQANIGSLCVAYKERVSRSN